MHCLYLGQSSPTLRGGGPWVPPWPQPSDPVPADLRADIKLRSPALFIYVRGPLVSMPDIQAQPLNSPADLDLKPDLCLKLGL